MTDPSWFWPFVLREGRVILRPLRRRDHAVWRQVRALNDDWLTPWESTLPLGGGYRSFNELVRANNRMGREGVAASMVIEVDGRLAGQITLGCIVWGSMRGGSIGYWIDRRLAGQGIVPTAVAMLTDHALFTLRMHRIEVNIRPENAASLRVVNKLGFRDEGVRERFLHIDGVWRDHRTFALTSEELPGGLLARWRARTSSAGGSLPGGPA